MGIFDDWGSLFTGRWTGGENSVADQFARGDYWSLAPVAAAAALPFAGAALGAGAGALGAGELAAGGAAEAGAAGLGEAFAFAPEAGAGSLPTWLAEPAAGAAGEAPFSVGGSFDALGYLPGGGAGGADAFGPTAALESGGGIANLPTADMGGSSTLDTLLNPGGAPNVPGNPMSLAPTGPGTTAGGGVPGFINTLTSPSQWTLGGVAQGVGGLAAAGGIANAFMKGQSRGANEDRLTNIGSAATGSFQMLTAEGNQLRSYLESGTLPKAQQAQVDQALKAEKTRLISAAAARGQSTDPNGNSALRADLAAAERNALILAGQLETQLFQAGQQILQTGLNSLGLSSQMYTTLANMDRQDTKDLNQAIGNFASALGRGPGMTLKVG